jgi:hypothetical protein
MKSLSTSFSLLSMALALGAFAGLAACDDGAPARGEIAGSAGSGGPDAACPSSPQMDAPCAEEGKVCTYGQTSQPSQCSPGGSWGYTRATCTGGEWSVTFYDGVCPGTPGGINGAGGAGGGGNGGTGGAGGAGECVEQCVSTGGFPCGGAIHAGVCYSGEKVFDCRCVDAGFEQAHVCTEIAPEPGATFCPGAGGAGGGGQGGQGGA